MQHVHTHTQLPGECHIYTLEGPSRGAREDPTQVGKILGEYLHVCVASLQRQETS